jgi:hypothetical protein
MKCLYDSKGRPLLNICVFVSVVISEPVTKFLLMLFSGFPCQYDHRRSGQFATDSLKRLTFQIAKIFLTFSWAG